MNQFGLVVFIGLVGGLQNAPEKPVEKSRLFVGCLTSQQHAIVYLRDGSAQTLR